MWDLPGPGLEPASPALAGGFLTTVPPGKSRKGDFYLSFQLAALQNSDSRLQPQRVPGSPACWPVLQISHHRMSQSLKTHLRVQVYLLVLFLWRALVSAKVHRRNPAMPPPPEHVFPPRKTSALQKSNSRWLPRVCPKKSPHPNSESQTGCWQFPTSFFHYLTVSHQVSGVEPVTESAGLGGCVGILLTKSTCTHIWNGKVLGWL